MTSYERCKIEYVYMLLFLFVITETNCISHKYDEPRHILMNGDVTVYEQNRRIPDALMKYGNQIVQKRKDEKMDSGEIVTQVPENAAKERIMKASGLSQNLSEINYTMNSASVDKEGRNVTCKGSGPGSRSPQMIALVAALATSVLCTFFTLFAMAYARRHWLCRRCRASDAAAAAAAAVTAAVAAAADAGRIGARNRFRKSPERRRRRVRPPTPYPSPDRAACLDAAGDAPALRRSASASSASSRSCALDLVGAELPRVHIVSCRRRGEGVHALVLAEIRK